MIGSKNADAASVTGKLRVKSRQIVDYLCLIAHMCSYVYLLACMLVALFHQWFGYGISSVIAS